MVYKRRHVARAGKLIAGKMSRGFASAGKPVASLVAAGVESAIGKYIGHIDKTEFEKPANSDTNINLNSTFNATSLYNKSSKKRKSVSGPVKKKKRAAKNFKRKVKKCLARLPPFSTCTINQSNESGLSSVPQMNNYTQDVWGLNNFEIHWLGAGQMLDPSFHDVSHVAAGLQRYGHVENGVAIVGQNYEKLKFWFSASAEFDLITNNGEFSDVNPLYVDIYEFVAARNISDPLLATPGLAWVQLHIQNNDKIQGSTDVVDTPNFRGNIPGKCPDMGKWWKTVKVTRVRMVSNNGPFHYKYETKGVWDPYKNQSLYAVKGITKGLVYVVGAIISTNLPANYDMRWKGYSKHFKFREMPLEGKDPNMDVKNSRIVI